MKHKLIKAGGYALIAIAVGFIAYVKLPQMLRDLIGGAFALLDLIFMLLMAVLVIGILYTMFVFIPWRVGKFLKRKGKRHGDN